MDDITPIRSPDETLNGSPLFEGSELLNDLVPGGEDLTFTVPFGDDEWDLSGHRSWKDKAGRQVVIDFRKVPPTWRAAAKELALLQMSPALASERAPEVPMAQSWPQIQEPVTPTTAQGNIKMLSHALRIIELQQITSFDSDDWNRLVVLLVQPSDVKEKEAGATLSAATGRGRAQQLIALWQACEITGRSGLLGDEPPFDGRETVQLFGPRGKRNTVRPHEDVGNVLGFVAWFFDHVAEDIVSHIEWWANETTSEPPMTSEETFDAMLELASRIAMENDGVLPGVLNRSGQATFPAAPLARLLGVYDPVEASSAGRWAKRQLGPTVTYSVTASPCPHLIRELPTRDGGSIAWADQLLPRRDSLDAWQRRLVYYAMYYLAATVMLRDSQLAVLPFDPIKSEEIARPNGTTYIRHTLSAFKTKNRHAAAPTSVVVNGRVARIIELLHRLAAALGYEPRRSPETGLPYLFDQLLATPRGLTPRVDAREGLYLDQWFLTVLKEGARELYDRGVIARNLDEIKLSMRQVRITCAQAYAVREHGQALAAAFGQWDTAAVAAGYVGDVYRIITPIDPAEPVDIAREDIGRRLVRMASAKDDLKGNGLGRLDQTIESNRAALSNPRPLTPARLRTLGKNNPNIEQGPFTMCIFQPEGAMCGGKGKSDFRLCWPGECRNSVMTSSDRARYELMRRQHLELDSPVLRRAAEKMDEANPEIAVEFAGVPDEDLQRVIAEHLDSYIQAALEDKA